MVKRMRKHMLLILWLVDACLGHRFFAQLFSHEAIIKAIFGLRLKKPYIKLWVKVKKPPISRTNNGITLQFQSTFLTGKRMHI